ncbi:MAG: nucleotidyl transferase AbiEii/AbiGii toxin family protein [Acidimicrobiales bacterium]
MSRAYEVQLTTGHILRHAPAQSTQGHDAALIDIAQDLLLRHLSDRGVLEYVSFKGGTALRKIYAGAAGRFSTDLDFSFTDLDTVQSDVIGLITAEIDGAVLGPFTYGVTYRRNRPIITYSSKLEGTLRPTLESKLDVGPPPWLEPVRRPWVTVPIHNLYGGPLPDLTVVSLNENIAEKIARLNRRSPARDAFDLVWVASTPGLDVDRALVRRVAALKIWVDLNGLTSNHHHWAIQPEARLFDVNRWLSPLKASDFDDENIGLLTTPPPDLDDLGQELSRLYGWLANLDSDELKVARGLAQDRALVLKLIGELPGNRLRNAVR